MRNTLETRLGIFFALTLIVAVIILEMVGVADFFKPGYHVFADLWEEYEALGTTLGIG